VTAIRDADAALTIAERLNLGELISEALNNKGAALSYLGRPREAIALMVGALEAAHAGGFLAAELRARSNLASVTWEIDPARAREVYWEASALARRVGQRGMANWTLSFAAIGNLVSARDWQPAVDALLEALAEVRSTTDERILTRSLAMLRLAMGQPIEAHLARLDELARELTDERTLQDVYVVRAGQAFSVGDHARAREEFARAAGHDEARGTFLPMAIRAGLWDGDPGPVEAMAAILDVLPEAEQPLNRADRAAARGAVAGLRGRRSEALSAFREAVTRYRDLAYDFDAARTTIDALHLLGPDDPELRRLADDARATLERVGAIAYLRLLDDALGRASARTPTASPSAQVEAAR
jgi:tetratricopeptide (TPR) repeat protein